jgi:thymidylate synthase
MAWNPTKLNEMALPPCHYGFQVTVTGNKLNLMWNQRSIDVALGLPFNISSYALLLHLLAKETGYEEGRLVGFLGDTHIYLNHIEGLKEQLARDPNTYPLPKIETKNFTNIFDWQFTDTELVGYESYPRIKFEIAV